MAAGEFVEVYSSAEQLGQWNAVATVFFLDTAHNVLEYIECIYAALKPGGLWLNIGPLLYHFADMPNEESIELPYAQIHALIEATGFTFLHEQTDVQTNYTQNDRSMMQYTYKSVFFVCRKPLLVVSTSTDDDAATAGSSTNA